MVADIGIGITMSPCQTSALNQIPKEFYPHGVAIINTLQQLSAAIGSSLFIGNDDIFHFHGFIHMLQFNNGKGYY
jgi:hypothetical protein